MYYTLVERCKIIKEAICNAPITTKKRKFSKTASSLLDLVKSYLRIEDKKFEVVDERNCVRTLDGMVRESLRDRIDNLTDEFLNELYEEGIEGSVQDFADDEISIIYAMRALDVHDTLEEMLKGQFKDDNIFMDSPIYLEVIRLYNELGAIVHSNGHIFDDDTISITLQFRRFGVIELILDNAYLMADKLNDIIDKLPNYRTNFDRRTLYDESFEKYHEECCL